MSGGYPIKEKIRRNKMSIASIINDYGKIYSPYHENLVNHLPMGQLAFYKLTQSLEKTKVYSEKFVQSSNINKVKTDYPKASSIDECLGQAHMYEACLDLITNGIKKTSINQYVYQILNRYELGISSGLFHTLIRVAYGVEGKFIDEDLTEELARALAYYVTGYKKANIFENSVKASDVPREMQNLIKNPHIRNKVRSQNSLGQRLKKLYNDQIYLKVGFRIDGSEEEKVHSLLGILIPAYMNSNDIVVLHCITGLHGLIVLKDYYDDFNRALDIMTTCIISHLLTLDNINIVYKNGYSDDNSWNEIKKRGSDSSDVHTIKLTYSASQLYEKYSNPGLKSIVLNRINNIG